MFSGLIFRRARLAGLSLLALAVSPARPATAPLPTDAYPRPVYVASPAVPMSYSAGAPLLSVPAVAPPHKAATGKMGSDLRALFDRLAADRPADARPYSTDLVRVRRDGAVQVYLTCTSWSDDHRARLAAAGFDYETSVLMPEILVQGWLPPSATAAVEAMDFVRWIRPPGYPTVNSGSVTAQSDGIMHATNVRSLLGVNGAGVRVGVMSDSADQRSEAQATGDLPSDASIYLGKVGTGGDEGTAMMEIVYDMAPGAQLGFYGPESSVDMANGITDLRNHGCNVIVDDLTFFDQPWYEEGAIEASISANAAAGVVYATSAGNATGIVVDTAFSGTTATVLGNSWTVHNFGNLVQGVQPYMLPMFVPAQTTTTLFLQWDSKWGSATDDYDLYVVDSTGNTLFAKSESAQGTGAGDNPNPTEALQVTNSATTGGWAFVVVSKYSGVDRNMRLYVRSGAFDSHYLSTAGTIMGNNKTKDGLCVAAIDAASPGNLTAESFSSRGPVRITYPVAAMWNKPDITGIDGVYVSGAGGFGQTVPGQTYKVFFGTSAAAPTVAAVAALIRSANPTLTPDQVKSAITTKALERGATGYDTIYGFGLADAMTSVQSVLPSTVLNFFVQPGGAVAGSPFTTQPVVKAVDGVGALVTSFTGPVTLAIKPSTGTGGAVLGGTTTVNAVGGLATFAGLSIDKAGTGYVLTASSTALGSGTSADSTAFNVGTPSTATKLAFTTQPGGAAAGQALSPQPVVAVQDAAGNLYPGYSGTVTMAIKPLTGTKNAVLQGTTTVNVVNGLANFTNLAIDRGGSGYVLRATSGSLTAAESSAINITFPLGDLNKDGVFNTGDAVFALRVLGGLSTFP